ncbi:MAG: leucine-rich repeat domain-containing protein [Candidatus Poribacteria bacterium]|nr:leucine-rich repeat domain-containing protein [Candidatus Poribacteria bacterium]
MQLKRLFLTLIVLFSFLPLGSTQARSPIVKAVHFVPRELPPNYRPIENIEATMDKLIKDTQRFYAEHMENHGFGPKTFEIETDANGQAVLHRVKGKFASSHYDGEGDEHSRVKDEIAEWADVSSGDVSQDDYYLVFIDHSVDFTPTGGGRIATVYTYNTSADIADATLAAHELGHCFGLSHDSVRPDGNWKTSLHVSDPMTTSFSAAEWLDVHPAFNPNQTAVNAGYPEVKMLPPSLAAPPNAIRLRFEVTDPDGLHQVQLIKWIPTFDGTLMDYQTLNGSRSDTVNFITTNLRPIDTVQLSIINSHGNIANFYFDLDISDLLPSTGIESILDRNLADAVRKTIGLGPDDVLTKEAMLGLRALYVPGDVPIRDLTGLEQASNLTLLNLGNTPSISDVSPLAGMTNLRTLILHNTSISDVSPLAGLTNLTGLILSSSSILDISDLAGMTNLQVLDLRDTSISNVSPLTGLTNLEHLTLPNTSISNVSPLAGLTNLRSLGLRDNSISDVSPLVGLTHLIFLGLLNNPLNDAAINTHIPAIQANGTQVWFSLPSRPVHIPDANLRAAVQLRIGNEITTNTMLKLTGFYIYHRPDPGTEIRDLTGFEHARNLRELDIWGSSISDVSPLAGLTQLTSLILGNNSISDVSRLAGLTQLVELLLSNNSISDISPLTRLTQLKYLDLRGNPLNAAAINTHIPAIQANGTQVLFDNRRPTGPIDPSQPAIYYETREGIQRTNLDSSNVTTLVPTEKVGDHVDAWRPGRLYVSGGKMYWTYDTIGSNSSNIHRANLDGSNVQTLVVGKGTISHLTVDVSGGKIYWIEKEYKQIRPSHYSLVSTKIRRANLDGSNVQTLVESKYGHGFSDLILDVSGGKIYWVDTSGLGIHRANLDGSNVEKLRTLNDLLWARESTLNISGGKMYWIGKPENENLPIRRANLDGTRVETLGTIKVSHTHEFTVDVSGRKIYWRHSKSPWMSIIQCANLDGSNVQTLVTQASIRQLALDVPGGKMYWAGRDVDSFRFKIWRANLDGSNIEDITVFGGTFVLIPSQAPADDASPAAVRKTTQIHVDAADRPPMYWIDGGTLYRLAGTEVERIAARANDVAVDTAGGKIYWTAQTDENARTINRANLDGTNAQVLRELRSVPLGIAYDSANGKLYLSNSQNRIQRINVDGTGFEYNFIPNVSAPMSIAVASGRVYWTEAEGNVRFANVTGNPKVVRTLATGTGTLGGIAAGNDKVYWTEQTDNGGSVRSANLDGSGVEDAFTMKAVPYGIAVDTAAGKVYWSDGAGNIRRRNLDGMGYEEIVSNLMAPSAVAIGGADTDTTTIAAAPARGVAAPDENLLLPNYPNPFNPETWIPYQLAESADVRVTIYDINGRVVRYLDLGHQRAGFYQSKARAAYWNGRNAQGEPVASGVYFYTLKAGDFSATKKMLIQK